MKKANMRISALFLAMFLLVPILLLPAQAFGHPPHRYWLTDIDERIDPDDYTETKHTK